MNRDEIIRMAREANLLFPGVDTVDGSIEQLARFFHLAFAAGAAAERNAILQMSRDQWYKTQADFDEAIRARGETK